MKRKLLFILLSVFSLSTQGQTWKKTDFKWCPQITDLAFEQLLSKPRLILEKDSVIIKYEEVITPKGQQWVQKKSDPNCISSDPNDCLVWCLVDMPEKREKRTIKVHRNNERIIEIKAGHWIERQFYDEAIIQVLCDTPPSDLLQAIIKSFIKLKYLRQINTTESVYAYEDFCRANLEMALKKYQSDNELPEGYWDEATLKSLGLLKIK
jgi:hypothetical protein